MEDVRKAYVWQEAVQLSCELVRICEDFSDADRNVLVWHLRQAIVDIPAGIAADLSLKREPSMEAVIKLDTELELVHRIYPAIDTGKAPEQLRSLMERMSAKGFSETEPQEPGEDLVTEQPQVAGGTVIAPNIDQITGPVTRIDPTRED